MEDLEDIVNIEIKKSEMKQEYYIVLKRFYAFGRVKYPEIP
jgi:hypothetical protein